MIASASALMGSCSQAGASGSSALDKSALRVEAWRDCRDNVARICALCFKCIKRALVISAIPTCVPLCLLGLRVMARTGVRGFVHDASSSITEVLMVSALLMCAQRCVCVCLCERLLLLLGIGVIASMSYWLSLCVCVCMCVPPGAT